MQSSTAQHHGLKFVTRATAHRLHAMLATSLFVGAVLLNPAYATPASARSAPTAIPPPDRRPSREITVPYHPRRPAPAMPASPSRPSLEPRQIDPRPTGGASRTPYASSSYRARFPIAR